MPNKKKGLSSKIYIAILLLIALVIVGFAVIYATYVPPVKAAVPGVHVGDTFTYNLKGVSQLGVDATTPDWFYIYNDTNYYKVTITGVNGSSVSLNTEWAFKNGTVKTDDQTIDLSNGVMSNPYGFWVIYGSNLKKGDLLRPAANDGVYINDTSTRIYSNSSRISNYFILQNEFYDRTDPTYSTYQNRYDSVSFDQQTGMLDALTDYQQYNNPQYNLVITWKLVATSVWQV